jgi:hypothetical protein
VPAIVGSMEICRAPTAPSPGPHPPHRTAETRGVVEPDLPAAVPDRDDAEVRTATDCCGCLHVQNQAGPGRRDRVDVDTFDTKKRVCPFALSTARAGSSIGHIRVSFYLEAMVAANSKGP